VLQDPQAALDDNVLENRPRWDVDGAAFGRDDDDSALQDDSTRKKSLVCDKMEKRKLDIPAEVDVASHCEMVQFDDLGDAGDALLEVGDLLEVRA
jgi:hypothetical protein